MDESTRQLLEACPPIDEATWLRHAAGFTSAFVAPPKRERWLDLLTRRPRRVSRDSHKLHSDLDRRTCRCVGWSVPAEVRGEGAFYDFFDAPRLVPADLVPSAAGAGDAIFSLAPGRLALYVFHEGEIWLCRAG
jgi:hypothetical protein